MIRITSRRHNFRRCGMPHPKDPVEYPDDTFSEEELDILRAEPMLTVETVTGAHEDEEFLNAARQAVAEGNTIQDGRPDAKAMSEILGETVKAKDRNRAWEIISKE
jgi:Mu-like prophage FluMu N-terminal domain